MVREKVCEGVSPCIINLSMIAHLENPRHHQFEGRSIIDGCSTFVTMFCVFVTTSTTSTRKVLHFTPQLLHIHAQIPPSTHVDKHAHTRAHATTHAQKHFTLTLSLPHTHVHTHTHMHTHTRTHTHTHTYIGELFREG